MPAPKTPESKPALAKPEGRKPWKKKSPVEVVLEQADKLKAEIAEMEEEIKAKRRQLVKFEEARKLFEGM
jgi:flagellar biosynthesis GTPase FlhF